jgi:2-polyprenyl-3-methyl-5-hydroxy-6-metoxy-1,4-benzoquinol methylase
MANQTDKAGEEYWSKEWSNFKIPDYNSITHKKAGNYIQWNYHELFIKAFHGMDVKGKKILEIGCGNSAWLAYFNKYWGMDVAGLDYSEEGCKKAKMILDKAGVKGDVRLADMFDAPADMKDRYDVVCSFGVVEHFDNTSEALTAAAVFLKPGGLLITTAPNHNGITGAMQRIFSKEIFNIHKIIDKKMLDAAAVEAGLTPVISNYFINMSLYANPGIPGSENPFFKFKKVMLKITAAISRVFWWIELKGAKFPVSKWYSAAVYNISRK